MSSICWHLSWIVWIQNLGPFIGKRCRRGGWVQSEDERAGKYTRRFAPTTSICSSGSTSKLSAHFITMALEINQLMALPFVAVSFFLHSFVACKEWITWHWLFCMSRARETWKNCTGTHRYRQWSYQRQLTASTFWCLATLIQPFLAALIHQWHLLSHKAFLVARLPAYNSRFM